MKKKYYTQLLLLFAAVPFYAQVNLSSSLTACYALNGGNATDAINALNGTLTGVSAAPDRFNNASSALSFSGTTSSYVELPNSPLIKPSTTITVSGWYNAASLNLRQTLVFAKNQFSSFHTAYGLAIDTQQGLLKFMGVRQDGTGTDFCTGVTTASINTWYHVVFSITSSTMLIYVNGVLENSTAPAITNFNYHSTRGVILGGTNELADNPSYNGRIDNLRFYNRLLTSAEVTALYNQDPPCIPQASPPVASFSVSNATICVGGTVSLTDLSTNNPNAWSWQIAGTATSTSGFQNPVMSFSAAGNYVVSLTSANSIGPSNTATQTITV
jgi:PKD repeat protein